ncbi:MAG: preprotein translocase subunit YajC [Longimicrobiales bacterium]
MYATIAVLAALQEGGAGPGMLPIIIQFAAIIAIFWFLLIRPQRKAQKQHKEMLATLQKGEDVMTDGGILGTVIHLTEDRVTIKTAENTRIVVARPKIQRVFRKAEGKE